jgi:hypothetical protein
LSQKLSKILNDGTDTRWMVSLSSDHGEKTLAELDREARDELEAKVMTHPSVEKIMECFPNALLERIEKDT